MMTNDQTFEEIAKCYRSAHYFINTYCKIQDRRADDIMGGRWIPFTLWPAQAAALVTILNNPLIVILKARQLGFTWLVLCYELWLMLFRNAAECLIFSRRETEARYLLDERMKGVYEHLPEWLRNGLATDKDSASIFSLSNGSIARAFPTSAGDSYNATVALADEFDLVENQESLMTAVKPTIDNGGQMILLSRSNKKRPESLFKRIYRQAKNGENAWVPIFVPWFAHPERDLKWYRDIRSDTLANTGYLDDLHEQYPATDVEALDTKTADKRIPSEWLKRCYVESKPVDDFTAPTLPGLTVYQTPIPDRKYIVGVDTAEGNPTSDDSSIEIRDLETGHEAACLAGKIEPSTTGYYASEIAKYYYGAPIIVERNNHGHAVLLWLQDNSNARLIKGSDGKLGWQTNTVSKAMMWSKTAEAARDHGFTLHSFSTYTQLSSIDGSTLSAPEGMHDDRAVAFALTVVGEELLPSGWEATRDLGKIDNFESPWT
jgi:hypothetical protein